MSTFLLCTSRPAQRSYTRFIRYLHTKNGRGRDAQAGQMLPYVLGLTASDRRWCLWGIQDHTGGPARSTSIQPISDVSPVLLPFYPFSCVVVHQRCMTHWWRSRSSCLRICKFKLKMSIICTSPSVSTLRESQHVMRRSRTRPESLQPPLHMVSKRKSEHTCTRHGERPSLAQQWQDG